MLNVGQGQQGSYSHLLFSLWTKSLHSTQAFKQLTGVPESISWFCDQGGCFFPQKGKKLFPWLFTWHQKELESDRNRPETNNTLKITSPAQPEPFLTKPSNFQSMPMATDQTVLPSLPCFQLNRLLWGTLCRYLEASVTHPII